MKFTDFLGLITGKEVGVQGKNANLFWKLVERGPIKRIKAKRRNFLSTNDLNSDRKLDVNYMKNRERRKKGEID